MINQIPPDVLRFIESPQTSSFALRQRYATDPVFRNHFDSYSESKLKRDIAADAARRNRIMNYHTIEDYKKSFEKFKIAKPLVWPRYNSPVAEDVLLCHLVRGQQPPGLVTVELGINFLAGQGLLFRTEGGSLKTDTQAHLDQIFARLDAPELTKAEIEFFQSLHPRDLEQRYWAEGGINEFAVRYNKAIKAFGFRQPGRPASAVDDDQPTLNLSAEEWRKIPASISTRRYMQEPAFKRATDKLIAEGKI
jgi:hypothetical protein